jgi:hypothetical protein
MPGWDVTLSLLNIRPGASDALRGAREAGRQFHAMKGSNTMLKPALVITLAIFSANSLVAQTSPPGWSTKNGGASNNRFGEYRNGRFMIADGEYFGVAKTIKGVAFRPSYIKHVAASTGANRTWTKVTLDMCETDYDDFTPIPWTKNIKTTPTRVFNKSMSWPSMNGYPTSNPGPWSIDFPFSSLWTTSGKRSVCLDFTFAGGKTTEKYVIWSRALRYALDAVYSPSLFPQKVAAASKKLGDGNSRTVGCFDSGNTAGVSASTGLLGWTYGMGAVDPALRGRSFISGYGYYFGPGGSTMTMLGFRSFSSAVSFPGITCNGVWVDTTLPTFLYPGTANAAGNLDPNDLGIPNGYPYSTALGSLELVLQTAWPDSKTGKLHLSSAASMYIPKIPTTYTGVKHKMAWIDRLGTQGGSGNELQPLVWNYR